MKLSKLNPLNWFKTKTPLSPYEKLMAKRGLPYLKPKQGWDALNEAIDEHIDQKKPMITLSKSQQIIFTLKQYPRQTIHEISKKTGLSLKDVSRHLADLRGRGKVDRDLDGAIVNDNKCAVWYLK